jgi:hypothetical protein
MFSLRIERHDCTVFYDQYARWRVIGAGIFTTKAQRKEAIPLNRRDEEKVQSLVPYYIQPIQSWGRLMVCG